MLPAHAREGTRADVGQLLMELDATDAEIKLTRQGQPRGCCRAHRPECD